MKYIHRDFEDQIDSYLGMPQIIAIVGPRRSGKTTFLKHLQSKLNNASYISFEDMKKLDLFTGDIESFVQLELQPYETLLIDEFQYAMNGGKLLKYIYDFHPGKKLIISGSSSVDLTIQAVKYLVGRVIVCELQPFSFSEFLRTKDLAYYTLHCDEKQKVNEGSHPVISVTVSGRFNDLLGEYILYGGYPEVVIEKDSNLKITLLNSIYSIYFLREVRDLLGLIEDHKLKVLLKSLSLQTGNLLSYSELSTLAGVQHAALKAYLNFFEKTFIAYLVKPYYTNKRVELVKNPKPFFFDPGFRNAVIDNFSDLTGRTDLGAMRENFAANELRRKSTLNFWRSKSGSEVDFITEKNGQLTPIEIKTRVSVNKVSLSLQSFISRHHPREAFVYTLDYSGETVLNGTTVRFLPLYLI